MNARNLIGATASARWAALVVVTFGAVASCADAPTTTPEPAAVNAAQVLPVPQQLTLPQVLGIHRALGYTAGMEASVAYTAPDPRVGDLTNRIANARIDQAQEIDRIAAYYGVVVQETPTSLQIYAQSNRDVAVLRALPPQSLTNAYVDGLVLSEARALGLSDNLLAPSAVGVEWLNAFVARARTEWSAQLGVAVTIQRARHNWRLDTSEPLPAGPVAPRPGPTIPLPAQ
jgi:hypothetical protein